MEQLENKSREKYVPSVLLLRRASREKPLRRRRRDPLLLPFSPPLPPPASKAGRSPVGSGGVCVGGSSLHRVAACGAGWRGRRRRHASRGHDDVASECGVATPGQVLVRVALRRGWLRCCRRLRLCAPRSGSGCARALRWLSGGLGGSARAGARRAAAWVAAAPRHPAVWSLVVDSGRW